MSLALSFETQPIMPWAEADGIYTSTRPNSEDAVATIASFCRYSGIQGEVAPSGGVYLKEDETITFAISALPWDPKPRDFFTPPGEVPRVVLSVSDNRFLKYWKLVVRNLILSYDLRQVATVYRPVVTANAIGLRIANLSVLTAAACRLQPISMTAEPDVAGKFTTRAAFDCYLGAPLNLLAGDVIAVAGIKYEVTEESEIDAMDTLTTARCERIS